MAAFDDPLVGLDFRHAIRDAAKGLVLKPVLTNYLYDAKFPAFTVHFPKEEMERRPDGWFHPSTHPLWNARQLYTYLRYPDLMAVERKEYMGTLSVTIGKAMHSFIAMCLEDAGVRPKALNVCTTCPPQAKCDEPGVIDEEAGERGHMDGLLDLSGFSLPTQALANPVFEFKTTNDMKLSKIPDLDLDAYKTKWPEYYAQNQSYMRMSGRRYVVVIFMAMGFPWQIKEFHVPFDPGYAQQIRNKYLAVRSAVEVDQALGDCCGAKVGCPSRAACPRITIGGGLAL